MIKIHLATKELQQATRNLCEATTTAKESFESFARIWQSEINAWRKRDARLLSPRRHSPGERKKRETAYIKAAIRNEHSAYIKAATRKENSA
jgi:hypothetical protein